MSTTEAVVQQALNGVLDPLLAQSITDLGMVQAVHVTRGGRVSVQLALPSRHWPAQREVMDAVQQAVASLPGVSTVVVEPAEDGDWTPYRLAQPLRALLGLPQDEPPPPIPLAAAPPGRARRLLQRLRRP